MGNTYFIIGHPVGLQVSGTLVEFAAILKADAVHHQVAVQMVGVNMGSYQHLEVWELTLNQFQRNGVGLLGRQIIRLRKGLHEVIVLSAVCLMEPLLGELHFGADTLGGTVPAGDQPTIFPCGFLFLLDIAQHTAQSTSATATIFDCGESRHQVTSRSSSRSCS